MAGILAGLQILLDTRAREQQHFAFSARFQLLGRQLLFRIFSLFLVMFLDLFLDRLAFPSSGHAAFYDARAIGGRFFFSLFQRFR